MLCQFWQLCSTSTNHIYRHVDLQALCTDSPPRIKRPYWITVIVVIYSVHKCINMLSHKMFTLFAAAVFVLFFSVGEIWIEESVWSVFFPQSLSKSCCSLCSLLLLLLLVVTVCSLSSAFWFSNFPLFAVACGSEFILMRCAASSSKYSMAFFKCASPSLEHSPRSQPEAEGYRKWPGNEQEVHPVCVCVFVRTYNVVNSPSNAWYVFPRERKKSSHWCLFVLNVQLFTRISS